MKKIKEPISGKGRVKLRVIEFELDGSDASLQESIRGILSSINSRTTVRPEPQALSQSKATPTEDDLDVEASDESVVEDSGTGEDANSGAAREKRPRTPPPTPKVLSNLDLNGTLPFATFWAQKKPESVHRRYLAIASWLKDQRQIDDIGIDHIYTCYRMVGLHPPKDVSQPLRDMKSKQGWFGNGKIRGTYAINHVGLAALDKE